MPSDPGIQRMKSNHIIPPVPLMDDAGECWLPTDEQLDLGTQVLTNHSSSSKLGGKVRHRHRPERTWAPSASARNELARNELGQRAHSCDGRQCQVEIDTMGRELLSGLSSLLQQHCKELGDFVDDRLAARNEELLRQLSEQSLRVSQVVEAVSAEDQGIASETPSKCDRRQWSFEQTEKMKLRKSRSFSATRARPGEANKRNRNSITSMKEVSWRSCRTQGRAALRSLVRSWYFEAVVCVMIITNVCFLGFEVQTLRGISEDAIPLIYQLVEYGYTCCFSCELIIRLLAFGFKSFFYEDETWAWNYIDFGLVMMSWFGTFLTFLIEVSPNLQYLRVLRMARTTRILRVVRIVKFFRPLRILVYSVMNTVRSLFWTLVLLMILIYLVGVLFTMATWEYLGTGRNTSLESNFGSLWASVASLFMSITGGIDWQNCTVALGALHPFWTGLFVTYIAFAHFAILNVVTGVVCQTAIESARQDQDIVVQAQLALKQRYVKQFQELFQKFDCDQVGQITLHDFESQLQDINLQNFFDGMDLSIDEAWNLFKLLDDQESCMIDIEEFVSGCLKLRGAARSMDVHMLIYQSKWTMKKLSHIMHSMEEVRSSLDKPYSSWASSARLGKRCNETSQTSVLAA